MFDPLDFLKLANDLVYSKDEAKLRTAISRAYYSAFLYCREWLRSKGWPLYGDGRDHNEVQMGLKKYIGRKASDKLSSLRRLRGDADYELTKVVDKQVVIKAIRLANVVINFFYSNPPYITS